MHAPRPLRVECGPVCGHDVHNGWRVVQRRTLPRMELRRELDLGQMRSFHAKAQLDLKVPFSALGS